MENQAGGGEGDSGSWGTGQSGKEEMPPVSDAAKKGPKGVG